MSGLDNKNYYELLGVSTTASIEQIKAAYHELARIFHPDSNFYSEIVETDLDPVQLKIFKEITLAYSTLTNEEKRKEYDKTIPIGLKSWEEEDDRYYMSLRHSEPGNRSGRAGAYGVFGSGAYPSEPVQQQTIEKPIIKNSLWQAVSGLFAKR